jgi:hypothetical protein
VGGETVSKVLMLRACYLWSALTAPRLGGRVYLAVLPAAPSSAALSAVASSSSSPSSSPSSSSSSSLSSSDPHPLLLLVQHHQAVASWAAGVALQSRAGLAANLNQLASLAKLCLKRGDAFTAAAVLQGVAAGQTRSFPAVQALAKVRQQNSFSASFDVCLFVLCRCRLVWMCRQCRRRSRR